MKCEARASDLTLTNHSDISPSRTSVMWTAERKHAKKSFKNNKKIKQHRGWSSLV